MTAVPRIEFVPLAQSDLPCLHEWLNRAHVAQWWDGPIAYNEVLERYGSHIESKSTRPWVVLLDGLPGGYVQSWIAALEEDWWGPVSDPGAVGIDVFLADSERLSRGVGTAVVGAFVSMLFEDPAVTRVQLDTDLENFRALRCYEKVGFRRCGIGRTPEGPVVLMRLERRWSPYESQRRGFARG